MTSVAESEDVIIMYPASPRDDTNLASRVVVAVAHPAVRHLNPTCISSGHLPPEAITRVAVIDVIKDRAKLTGCHSGAGLDYLSSRRKLQPIM